MKRRKLPGREYLPFIAWCLMGVVAGIINENYMSASLVVIGMASLLFMSWQWPNVF